MKLPFTLFTLLLGASPALANIPSSASCAVAGRAAELADSLPANLLLSIGIVESGRANPFTGHSAPWPWTVNVDGNGKFFANKLDAEAFVRLAQASGARDIDVGCFQISLEHHPGAFASLSDAFDPATNAAYAALYLTHLKAQTGSWNTAIADYHSFLPDLGLPYQRQVLAAWKRLGNVPPNLTTETAHAAVATPDQVVVIQSPEAREVHVYTMNTPDDASWRPGLPHVIDNP
ncbi:transglycosylase SLT domain-containing protein [Acidocella sp.]|uniref:transglycosylase SLT domain-containing protein n=1 Tax=Acidocella sp. TaxID=50710 RepID=UPI002609C78D|nr:transglycosylase SLT domain-containing protein [Acidocella sp.]